MYDKFVICRPFFPRPAQPSNQQINPALVKKFYVFCDTIQRSFVPHFTQPADRRKVLQTFFGIGFHIFAHCPKSRTFGPSRTGEPGSAKQRVDQITNIWSITNRSTRFRQLHCNSDCHRRSSTSRSAEHLTSPSPTSLRRQRKLRIVISLEF
jgi:hypothetical protein